MPDPKIRQRKFEWAEPEAPTLTSEWTHQYQYKVGSKIKTPKGVFTVTSASASNAMAGAGVLTKKMLQDGVNMLKAMKSSPPVATMHMMHPFAIKDLLLDKDVAYAIDLEAIEQKVIQQWEDNVIWGDDSSPPSPSSLSV